jgi:acetyltransferase-like isoleucine patch superfamily enzyme
MSLDIVNGGIDNHISYSAKDESRLNGKIIVRGDNNHLAIGPDVRAGNLQVTLGTNCRIVIGGKCRLGSLFIHAAQTAHVSIGRGCIFNGRVRLLLHEAARIEIGSDCLFASEIDITVSDMHSIVDVASGARVNPPRDVNIGERVWIGQRSMLLKGSHIEAGSIVGAGSIVTGHVPPNSLAAGNPARVTRSGVTWNHRLLER